MILQGKHVTLRPLTTDDAATTQGWRMSGRAFLLNRGAQSVEQQKVWIASRALLPEYNFIMEVAGQPVGMISLEDIDLAHKRAQPAHLLIGEPEKVQGLPVALEAVQLLYGMAFDKLRLRKLWGPIASENKQMITWQKFLGFEERGRLQGHYHLNGTWQDAVIVELTRERYDSITVPKLRSLIR